MSQFLMTGFEDKSSSGFQVQGKRERSVLDMDKTSERKINLFLLQGISDMNVLDFLLLKEMIKYTISRNDLEIIHFDSLLRYLKECLRGNYDFQKIY